MVSTLIASLFYYLIIIPISLLPFPVLYALSDFLFFVIYRVIGYRKAVVMGNIKNSFPDKTEKEHQQIQEQFYHHLCDLVVESLKAFTISEKEVLKRVKCKNPEMIDAYALQNKSVIVAGGHYNNWEIFAVAVDKIIKHQTIGIYKPLTNKFFDEKMRSTRSKYGLLMIPTNRVKHYIEKYKGTPIAVIFGFDQSPSNPYKAYWTKFLNQETAVLYGTEKFAREYNYPVVYGRINKERRGYYTFEFFKVTDNPNELRQGAITEEITNLLEKDIQAIPQYWLWSHKRWKHKRPADYKQENI
jgi:Kdo2-lipid IVA lauroyltransferase/acyltransferase